MKVNTLEMEWTDTGCVAKATGFDGIMLTCPRCGALLPREYEHRCGDQRPPLAEIKPKSRRTNRLGKPCIDCGDGPCDMNCGPAIPAKVGRA